MPWRQQLYIQIDILGLSFWSLVLWQQISTTDTQHIHDRCSRPCKWAHHSLQPPHLLACPVNIRLQGFFYLLTLATYGILVRSTPTTNANAHTDHNPHLLSHPPPRRWCGVTEMWLHVSVTSSVGAKPLWRRCWDVEPHFCDFHIGIIFLYIPPTWQQQPHQARGAANTKIHGGARTTPVVLAFRGSWLLGGRLNQIEGFPMPLCHQKEDKKSKN